jgi:hypothetical protein
VTVDQQSLLLEISCLSLLDLLIATKPDLSSLAIPPPRIKTLASIPTTLSTSILIYGCDKSEIILLNTLAL